MPYLKASRAAIVSPMYVNGTTVARELARKGLYVVGVDSDENAPGLSSRYVKERAAIPPPESNPNALSDYILGRRDLYGGIVVPTDDYRVLDLHSNFDALSKHYHLAVSPGDSTAIALDKWRAVETARTAGVPVPRTVRITSEADIAGAADEVPFPAILRARFSLAFVREFGRKNFPVENRSQVEEFYHTAAAGGHEMLLQETIPGEDRRVVSCKGYVSDEGEPLFLLPGVKLLQYPPVHGVGQVQEARKIPKVEELSERVLRAMGLRGTVCAVEFKYDARDGLWKFLEVNCRTLMSTGLLKFAGADALEMLYRDKTGLPQLPLPRIRYGRKIGYVKNALLRHRGYPESRLTPREYLHVYGPPITFGMLDLRDLKPFIRDIWPLFRRRFSSAPE